MDIEQGTTFPLEKRRCCVRYFQTVCVLISTALSILLPFSSVTEVVVRDVTWLIVLVRVSLCFKK